MVKCIQHHPTTAQNFKNTGCTRHQFFHCSQRRFSMCPVQLQSVSPSVRQSARNLVKQRASSEATSEAHGSSARAPAWHGPKRREGDALILQISQAFPQLFGQTSAVTGPVIQPQIHQKRATPGTVVPKLGDGAVEELTVEGQVLPEPWPT